MQIECGTEKEKQKYGRKHSRRSSCVCVCVCMTVSYSLGGLFAAWNCGIIFGYQELVSVAEDRIEFVGVSTPQNQCRKCTPFSSSSKRCRAEDIPVPGVGAYDDVR